MFTIMDIIKTKSSTQIETLLFQNYLAIFFPQLDTGLRRIDAPFNNRFKN